MENLDKNSIEILSRNFDLEEQNNAKLFKDELVNRIAYLLNYDFEKLLWILYRVDVNEKLVRQVLSDTENDKPSESLAELIIQRQIQKAETRKRFGNNEKGDL